MSKKIYKILSLLLCLCLVFEQVGFAQSIVQLDISGYLTSLRNNITQDRFRPLHLRYLAYDPLNNNFSLLVDKGSNSTIEKAKLENSAKPLLDYFFIGLSLPNDDFWVNLRPDAETNIIDDELAKTDIGRIMLEADVQLKKDTARYTSPNTPEGKEYWDKLYKKAGEIFGYENIEIPTLTRPWIVPDEILVGETRDGAYVFKATLKVLLEQDYLKDSAVYNFNDERLKALNEYSSQLIRELIIPKITQEVNTSKKYAPLRQVYYSLILAQWFKAKFNSKDGYYTSLMDGHNLQDLTSKEAWSKTTYFKQYQKSFKDGEYNTQESVYTPYGQTIRSYFSGGIKLATSSPVNNAFPGDIVPDNPNVASLNYDGNTGRIKAWSADSSASPVGLRNSKGESLQTVLKMLKPYLDERTVKLWDSKEGEIEVDFLEYIEKSVNRTFQQFASPEEKREAVRLQDLTNDKLENDSAVQELLRSFGDLKGQYTLASLLDRLSESDADGLVHYIATPTGAEITLRKSMASSSSSSSSYRKRQYEDLIKRSILYKVLIRELLYRWNLSDGSDSVGNKGFLMADSAVKVSSSPAESIHSNSVTNGENSQKAFPTDGKTGGIDFHSLPIVTNAIGNLRIVSDNIPNVNLTSEWREIERLVQSGITPAGERIKEYLQVSCYQGKIIQDRKKVVNCISEIFRQQEENYVPTEPILRDILVVLESNSSMEDFRAVFISVKP